MIPTKYSVDDFKYYIGTHVLASHFGQGMNKELKCLFDVCTKEMVFQAIDHGQIQEFSTIAEAIEAYNKIERV